MRRFMWQTIKIAVAMPVLATASAVVVQPAGAANTAVSTSCVSGVAVVAASGTVGTARGILRPQVPAASSQCQSQPATLPRAQSAFSAQSTSNPYEGGTPPLLRGSGDTMGTASAPGAITLTPIFWAPPGSTPFPAGYEAAIASLDANLAAQSGLRSTVLSELTQYTAATGAHLANTIIAGTPIVDTTTTPSSLGVPTCTPDSGPIYNDNSYYSLCLNDQEISAEVVAQVTAHSLPSDRAHLYSVFTPEGAEVCFSDTAGSAGSCTPNTANPNSGFCAYHSSSTTASDAVIYATMPYSVWDSATGLDCNSSPNQFPQGSPAIDVIASSYVHEIAEAITDPVGTAWLDSHGNEIGDLCAYSYGPTKAATNGSQYSQVFNGAKYYIQQLFSNAAYALHHTAGCQSAWTAPTVLLNATGVLQVKKAISFTAVVTSPSGAITARKWKVAGVAAGTGATLSHTFMSPGSYTVALAVTDAGGYTTTATTTVMIKATPRKAK